LLTGSLGLLHGFERMFKKVSVEIKAILDLRVFEQLITDVSH